MSGMASMSDLAWAEFLATAGASLARWNFRPRPAGKPVPTSPHAAFLIADGHACLVAYQAGQVVEERRWLEPTTLCTCVDGWRNQPLINCPHCRGEGTVTK